MMPRDGRASPGFALVTTLTTARVGFATLLASLLPRGLQCRLRGDGGRAPSRRHRRQRGNGDTFARLVFPRIARGTSSAEAPINKGGVRPPRHRVVLVAREVRRDVRGPYVKRGARCEGSLRR